jgi:uncharacterized Zn-binding protein involved in type VI secretion
MKSNKPIFNLNNKLLSETNAEYVDRYMKESAAYRAALVVVSRHYEAVIGSKTKNSGEVVTASSNSSSSSFKVARVGDKVRYSDGREEIITSGAGIAFVCNGQSLAIVGSHVSGGDMIVSTPVQNLEFILYENDPLPEGFLVKGYVPNH